MDLFENMNFGHWVAVVTNSITAMTAVVMAILAYRTYLKAPEQEAEPQVEKVDDEVDATLKQITVFKTSRQETILKVGPNGLECHIIDNRPGRGGHQWTISKADAQNILNTSNYRVNTGFKANTGTFSVGPRRNWLYSKKLFPEPDYLHGTLTEILTNAVGAS